MNEALTNPAALRGEAVIPPEQDGSRVDHALALLAPGWGLNARRRIWERCRVLLDGRRVVKGDTVQAGQRLRLEPLAAAPEPDSDLTRMVRVAARAGQLAALVKPAGLHSQALAGRAGPSLEGLLPRLFPAERAILLNRLDQPTSGLVLAALSEQAASRFRVEEKSGRVRKEYLALAAGRVEEALVLTGRLLVDDRAKSRLLDEADPDPLRHTQVLPLRFLPERQATLVRAVIRRGARHQIRAHLAGAGHPILGDELYGPAGSAPELAGQAIYLHHRRLELAGFSAEVRPDWPGVLGEGDDQAAAS